MPSKMVLAALGFDPASALAFGDPVNDLSELSALISTSLRDKQIRVVESVGSIYRFDLQSMVGADGVKTIRPVNVKVTDAGRWHLQATMAHSQLDGLTDDGHSQYIHKDVARTITAIHTFNPAETAAPFILGAKAQGQVVTGLNADLLDGKHADEFLTSRLQNGMPAYLEPVSKTLISIATVTVTFALSTPVLATRNVYLNNVADIASNTLGFVIPRNAMLIATTIAISQTVNSTANTSFQLRRNGGTTALISFAVPANSKKAVYNAQHLQLNAGDELQAYISASSGLSNPIMTLELAWRD